MATVSTQPITFVVSGRLQTTRDGAALRAPDLPGRLKASVRLSTQRGSGDTVRVSAVPGEDVVVLRIAGGPTLLLHPENARELMLSQGGRARSATPAGGEVAVAAELGWRGLEQAAPTRARGFLGQVLLSVFEVITGFGKDELEDLAAAKVVALVDGQVDAGLYSLRPEALLPLKGSGQKQARLAAATGPLLVLIHGTFVETVSTFGSLWTQHPQRVRELFAAYDNRVYALDHPTLGASPIANALTLVQALPQGARLHLATHSRGGLVAEVLARVAGRSALTQADLDFFPGAEYEAQRGELQALAAAVAARGIRVERVLRVACPARGTLLASRRLDAYLSVLKWSLELAGVPAVPVLLEFLTEVARRRTDPRQIPGLAAMIPDTPLVNWLNGSGEAIAGELRVVAGDLQGDSVTSWLKTLLADAYYRTDNDIVVQTSSMYAGTPRAGGATFLLDQGGKVTHFNYFSNGRTVAAVVDGLTQAQPPSGFGTIGPLSWAGQDAGGLRAARRGGGEVAASARPAVFVLPGILGSNLKVGGTRIWLSLSIVGGLDRLGYRAGVADGVEPDGPIGLIYDELIDHLSASHEVIPFAYDWRRPLEVEACRLADAVEQALDARNASGQPVRLLAHSMGGLLARTLQLERPDTWARLMARAGGRLLMLGTPNGGSWAPMQVLSGDDTLGNALAAFGSPLRDHHARQLMAEMPGFIQLQAALLDPQRKLDRSDTWAQLAADDLRRVQEHNWWHNTNGEAPDPAYQWGVPTQAVLDQARALRVRLEDQRAGALKVFADRLLLVVGRAKFTPDGYELSDQGLVYLDAVDGGDGRVALESALLPGVRTWTLDCDHGSLPAARTAFAAFDELLAQGDTAQLAPLAAAQRGGAGGLPQVRSRPSRARPSALPAQTLASVFESGHGAAAAAASQGAPLRISVLNGNLAFVNLPLLLGHYRSMKLTGTESVINEMVDGVMGTALDAGLYPEAPGSHQIFVNNRCDPDNPWLPPRPPAAIVVGLGEEGKLTERDLTTSVRQAVIAWSQRTTESKEPAAAQLTLAATLIGSGGLGITPGAAARAIAQGVRESNDRLAKSRWPLVGELTLVELYLERASDAWHGLRVLATASPDRYEVAPVIAFGTGPLRRQIDSGYRGADYDFITATQGTVADSIAFTLDTRRARTEVRAQKTQGKLLRELVRHAATERDDDPRLGRTLLQLLVPVEVEPFLGGTGRMLLELDETTAPIPWELLETSDEFRTGADPRPWAIRSRLLRKLRKDRYRNLVHDASADDAVLVIGQPQVDPTQYGPLPGAQAEAEAVARLLGGPRGVGAERLVALLDQPDASLVINSLLDRRYRVVHVAGHGEAGSQGGVVLSDGTFLGPHEIESMRIVPELVFVNCCHLAGRSAEQTLAKFNPADFAAGVADMLIEIGVRCVVAAGWAVDDGPAKTFATTFYRELLAGAPFINAAGAAREAAWAEDRSSKTWAAYQCYGDPNWIWKREGSDAQTVTRALADEYDGIASALGLVLALEELAVQARFGKAQDTAGRLERVGHLEARFAAPWRGMGAVAEAFAVAYAESGDSDAAIRWYEQALQCNDASASIKAHEQLGSLRAHRAWSRVAQAAPGGEDFATGLTQLQQALQELQALADLQPTMERLALVGSTCKRLAQLHGRAGQTAQERTALEQATAAYRQSEARALSTGHAESLFYPALNRMALELVSSGHTPEWAGFAAETTAAVRRSLQLKASTDPDFWSWVGLADLTLYEVLAGRNLTEREAEIESGYADIQARVQSKRSWGSVADQAGFVLRAYAGAAPAAEAQAALRLLATIEGYVR